MLRLWITKTLSQKGSAHVVIIVILVIALLGVLGYYSQATGRCGQGADSNTVCLDQLMLIPANETFTNPDQFQVNIGVFNNKGLSPQEWFIENTGPGGTVVKTSTDKVNGYDAYRYETKYGNNEVHLSYAIKLDDNIVLISSNLFNGDYYSYKS